MNKDLSVISIVTWNRKDSLQKVLDSIFEHTLGKYQIYITDNGSTDGTVDYLKEVSKKHSVDVLYLRENLGIAKARNAHWHKCVGYDVVRMDDDIVIETNDWFNIYRDVAYRYHAFTGRLPESAVAYLDGNINDDLIFADSMKDAEHSIFSVSGQLMFIPKDSIYSIGYWNENYGMSGFEDIDYALKGAMLGYTQIFVNTVKTKHLFKTSNICGEEDKRWNILGGSLGIFHHNLESRADELSTTIRFNLPTNKTVSVE